MRLLNVVSAIRKHPAVAIAKKYGYEEHHIVHDNKVVGKLHYEIEPDFSDADIKHRFNNDIPKSLADKLPKKSTYHFIVKLLVNKPYRGKGIGSAALVEHEKAVQATNKPHVVALQVHSYLKNGMAQKKLRNFYEKRGYETFQHKRATYGIKIHNSKN